MTGINHTTGGVVFTGIFASFWNVNIFASPLLLGLTAFFALLPDVDHTKSPIGKLFYPISHFLDRKFGHRTITHSLVCYGGLAMFIGFLEANFFVGSSITLIFMLAYLSHLIFDMMTRQGIPFFYPFKRNACVIPGNPELRLSGNDLRSEMIVFVFFILLGITCKNLFEQGFWSTYNRQFDTLKHVANEQRNNPEQLVNLNYDFTYLTKNYKGTGIIISATESETKVLNDTSILTLNKSCTLHNLEVQKTDQKRVITEHLFSAISLDSFNILTQKKIVLSLKLQSKSNFTFLHLNAPKYAKNADVSYIMSPKIIFEKDTAVNSNLKNLEILNYQIAEYENKKLAYLQTRNTITNRINEITRTLSTMDFYQREEATKELSKLKTELANLTPVPNSDLQIKKKYLIDAMQYEEAKEVSGFMTCLAVNDL